jgi:hypothetical protein
MHMVEFIKPVMRWQPGDIASFSELDARFYITKGVAMDAGPMPRPKQRTPHPGEPGYIHSVHGVIHGPLAGGQKEPEAQEEPNPEVGKPTKK